MLTLICILVISKSVTAAILDTDCVGPDGKYNDEATVCQDKEAYCKDLFPTPVINGTDLERPPFCFSSATPPTLDKTMKQVAVTDCAKSCGYCCLSTQWNCKNPAGNQMNCANIDPTMCNSTIWRSKIAKFCPNKCGFCLEGGCVDAVPDLCDSQPQLCTNFAMQKFAMENCARTCNNCDGSKTPK